MAFPGLIRIFLGKTTNNLVMQSSVVKKPSFHKKICHWESKNKTSGGPASRKKVGCWRNWGWNLLRNGTERNGCRKLNISAQIKNKKLPGRSFFQYFLSLQGTKKSWKLFWAEFSIFVSLFLFSPLRPSLERSHSLQSSPLGAGRTEESYSPGNYPKPFFRFS